MGIAKYNLSCQGDLVDMLVGDCFRQHTMAVSAVRKNQVRGYLLDTWFLGWGRNDAEVLLLGFGQERLVILTCLEPVATARVAEAIHEDIPVTFDRSNPCNRTQWEKGRPR